MPDMDVSVAPITSICFFRVSVHWSLLGEKEAGVNADFDIAQGKTHIVSDCSGKTAVTVFEHRHDLVESSRCEWQVCEGGAPLNSLSALYSFMEASAVLPTPLGYSSDDFPAWIGSR